MIAQSPLYLQFCFHRFKKTQKEPWGVIWVSQRVLSFTEKGNRFFLNAISHSAYTYLPTPNSSSCNHPQPVNDTLPFRSSIWNLQGTLDPSLPTQYALFSLYYQTLLPLTFKIHVQSNYSRPLLSPRGWVQDPPRHQDHRGSRSVTWPSTCI